MEIKTKSGVKTVVMGETARNVSIQEDYPIKGDLWRNIWAIAHYLKHGWTWEGNPVQEGMTADQIKKITKKDEADLFGDWEPKTPVIRYGDLHGYFEDKHFYSHVTGGHGFSFYAWDNHVLVCVLSDAEEEEDPRMWEVGAFALLERKEDGKLSIQEMGSGVSNPYCWKESFEFCGTDYWGETEDYSSVNPFTPWLYNKGKVMGVRIKYVKRLKSVLTGLKDVQFDEDWEFFEKKALEVFSCGYSLEQRLLFLGYFDATLAQRAIAVNEYLKGKVEREFVDKVVGETILKLKKELLSQPIPSEEEMMAFLKKNVRSVSYLLGNITNIFDFQSIGLKDGMGCCVLYRKEEVDYIFNSSYCHDDKESLGHIFYCDTVGRQGYIPQY